MKKEIKRIPRPKHSTYINQTNPNNLLRHILLTYINNNYTLNNQAYTLQQIAYALNISYIAVQNELTRIYRQTASIFNRNNKGLDTLHGALWRCLENATMDRGLIHQQVSLLLSSQGDGYKPFISSEVTKALQTLMASNKNMADIVKSMMPTGPTSNTLILNQIPGQSQPNPTSDQGTPYLTIEAANKLVQGLDFKVLPAASADQIPAHIGGLGRGEMEVPEDYNEVPEIDARRQHGIRPPMAQRDETRDHDILPNDVDD